MKKKSEKRTTIVPPTASDGRSDPEVPNPNHEEIARLAYSYWEARAFQGGSPDEDWFRAEKEIKIQGKPPAAARA